jgi:polar amino acid transport system permease protein
MATTEEDRKLPQDRATPPDVRGPTAPLPAGIFALGGLAIGAVLLGSAAVQISYAVSNPPLTPACTALPFPGLIHFDPTTQKGIKGAEGVCHIIEAARSTPETILLVAGILLGVAAAAAGFATYRRMDTSRRREHALAGAALGIQAAVLAVFLLWFRSGKGMVTFTRNFLNFTLLHGQFDAFVRGAKNTLVLAFGGEVGGIAIGLLLAMLAISARRTVRAPARTYINFFRGTPLIFQLSFFYFLITLGLQLHVDTFKVALLVFALNTGAYASEVFRAGIQSIERGQIEAARSLGFSYIQAMRYAIVPQAVRRVIPPLMNEFVILIKDTALIVVLGLLPRQLDIYNTAREGYASTFSATFFVAAAMAYLVVTLPLIGLVNYVERRLRSGLVGITGAGG